MSPPRLVNLPSLGAPVGYSNGVVAQSARLLFVAGQVALSPQGELVGKDDARAQTQQIFENLKAVLEAAERSLQQDGMPIELTTASSANS